MGQCLLRDSPRREPFRALPGKGKASSRSHAANHDPLKLWLLQKLKPTVGFRTHKHEAHIEPAALRAVAQALDQRILRVIRVEVSRCIQFELRGGVAALEDRSCLVLFGNMRRAVVCTKALASLSSGSTLVCSTDLRTRASRNTHCPPKAVRAEAGPAYDSVLQGYAWLRMPWGLTVHSSMVEVAGSRCSSR
jgi:hypothetical protein